MKIDLQDVLLIAGIALIALGIGLWSVPASLVVLGLICLGLVVLMQRAGRIPAAAEGKGRAR